jgi:uncharacterized membrane protein YeaQ/YmgE (transglycosylase-associated protein family)
MFGALGWIALGLIVGALAKLVMPGRDPGGIIVTILLGVAGSVVGGYIGSALGLYEQGDPAALLISIAGAIVILALYRLLNRFASGVGH